MNFIRSIKHRLAFTCLLVLAIQSSAKADAITDFGQQVATVENTASSRAVYLGRLFNNVDPGAFRRMESMYAIVTIAQATNVALFIGDASSGFEAARAANKIFDSGLRVSTATQDRTEVVFVPGDPSLSPPKDIPIPAGLGIHDSLALNNRLDFWLVGESNSGFTVPSVLGSNPAIFFMEFNRTTSVPEPSSIALLAIPAVGSWMRLRRKKKQLAIKEQAK
jgi:hypothetical protein